MGGSHDKPSWKIIPRLSFLTISQFLLSPSPQPKRVRIIHNTSFMARLISLLRLPRELAIILPGAANNCFPAGHWTLTTLMSGHYQWSRGQPPARACDPWLVTSDDCCHRDPRVPTGSLCPRPARSSVNCQVWNITGGKTHLYNTMHQINLSNGNNHGPYGVLFRIMILTFVILIHH